MPSRGEIKSEKILVKDIFSRMWFRIPEYQRPYVWGREEISDLLDDLTFAMTEKPDFEYFLGSFVFQSKPAAPDSGQEFDENDLLDGQQRMATLLMLFAVLRDLSDNPKAKKICRSSIYQEGNEFANIPERTRLVFAIRDEVQQFIDEFVNVDGGTDREKDLATKRDKRKADLSVRNMAAAILEIRRFFRENPDTKPEDLLQFLLNKVLLIYVSTEDLEDAFRLFMILNDRGIPLRNSDILKSMNLGALEQEEEKVKYATMWEEAESELGDDFDRFLNHVRTILLKEKARGSLLKEFEEKIYNPKGKPPLLKKGRETFELIGRYLEHYRTLLRDQNDDKTGHSYEFDNLIQVMLKGLPGTDWVPPLLRYFDKFKDDRILEFLKRLDNKFSADWICGYTSTYRIAAMNKIIQAIDDANTVDDLFSTDVFDIDEGSLLRMLDGPVYSRKFARYLLLKLDYLYQNHAHRMNFDTLSVEHVLPQNPSEDSQWVKDFSEEERNEWTDRLGNLVLITRRKNSSLGRLDYSQKLERYFEENIDTCPNSLRVLRKNKKWTPAELKANHRTVIKKLGEHYGINVDAVLQSGT